MPPLLLCKIEAFYQEAIQNKQKTYYPKRINNCLYIIRLHFMKKIDEINDIDELIVDYITGRLTPDKFNYLNSWIAESKENLLYFRKLQEIWYAAAPQDDNVYDKELAYNRFLYRINESGQSETVIPRNKFFFTKRFIQIAASVAIIIVLGSISFLKFLSSPNPKDEFYSITVPYGSKSKVTLSDSTKVWLNSGTTIEYRRVKRA